MRARWIDGLKRYESIGSKVVLLRGILDDAEQLIRCSSGTNLPKVSDGVPALRHTRIANRVNHQRNNLGRCIEERHFESAFWSVVRVEACERGSGISSALAARREQGNECDPK